MKYYLIHKFENFCWKIAKIIPARLKYYCFNLVLGYATTGNYGSEEVTSITWQIASQRFTKDHNI